MSRPPPMTYNSHGKSCVLADVTHHVPKDSEENDYFSFFFLIYKEERTKGQAATRCRCS